MSRSVIVLLSGRICQAVLTVVSLRLLTALLSPAQVGSVYLVLSFVSWFGLFLVNPAGMYINRRLHAWHDRGLLLSRLKIFNLYVAGVAGLSLPLVFIAKSFVGLGSGIPVFQFMTVVALYVYSVTWNQTVIPTLNMLGRRGIFVFLSIFTTALGLLFSASIVFLSGKTAASWLYGQILGMSVVYLLAYKKLEALEQPDSSDSFFVPQWFSGETIVKVWLFAGPLAGATFFMWVQTQSYRLIVDKFAGPAFLGYLVVGLGIATSLAGVAESLVQQLYFPAFYKKLHSGGVEDRRTVLSELAAKALPIYLILSIFTCCLARHLTRLLVDPGFQGVWKFTAMGACIEFFRMLSNIYSAAAHAEMKTSALVWPYFWGGLFTCTAVIGACILSPTGLAIPLAMALGSAATFAMVKSKMARLSKVKSNPAVILKSLLLAAGFIPALFFGRQESLWQAMSILTVFGVYFIFAEWLTLKMGKRNSLATDLVTGQSDIVEGDFMVEV